MKIALTSIGVGFLRFWHLIQNIWGKYLYEKDSMSNHVIGHIIS